MKIKYFILAFFAFFVFKTAGSQVIGCTDPRANNYNPEATINDGSCEYNITLINPPLRYLLPSELDETSGLAFFNGKLWTINDSGGLPALYAFDTISGEIVQRITVSNAQNVDWEALAMDADYIYIGDFGNNAGTRDDLVVYKVSLSDIPNTGNNHVIAEKIWFSYSDYPGKEMKPKNHNYDCEAFIATDDSLYLFSKNRGDQRCKLYILPKIPGEYTAQLVSSFDSKGLITGADINIESKEITLVGYVNQTYIPFMWLLFDYDGNNYFDGNKRRIDMPNILASQTEAVCYTQGRNEVLTSEGNVFFSQSAYDFNSSVWTSSLPSGVGEEYSGVFDFTLSPNPINTGKLTIDITDLPIGLYQLEVYDSLGNKIMGNNITMRKKSGRTKIKLKVSSYNGGIYYIRMYSTNQVVEKKFIKI
jgi:hypothetical protein